MEPTATAETVETGAVSGDMNPAASPETETGSAIDDLLGDGAGTTSEPIDSLFESEVHSSQKDATEPDTDGKSKEPGASDPDSAGKKAADETSDSAEGEGDEPGKPPKGFVPHQALKEEREKAKSERQGRMAAEERSLAYEQELAALREENKALKEGGKEGEEDPQAERFKDFKELTRSEFKALQDDDPVAAQDYLYDLDDYRRWVADKARTEESAKKIEQTRKEIIESARNDMKELVPELFGQDAKVAQETDEALTAFAESHGMDRASLAILTNPEVEVVIPGDKNRYVLGNAAANLLRMIVSTHKAISLTDPEHLKAIAEKEVTGRVTREIASKLKDGSDVRSLGDAAPSGVEKLDMNKPISERDWAKLSPEERQRRLGGG